MDIIPAIDLIEGKCVRLEKGDFEKKIIYSDHPLDIAKKFEDAGITRLHMVDLDGARGNGKNNLQALEAVASKTDMVIDFGGGLKTTEEVSNVFNAGAAMANIGSIAVKNPALFKEWIDAFDTKKFLPGADVLDKKIRIHGWQKATGIGIFDFIKSMVALKIGTIFCTDISKDGMMRGPSTELYKEILNEFAQIKLIASGGISCYDDLLILKEAGCAGAIIGKAYYEGKISLKQIQHFLISN